MKFLTVLKYDLKNRKSYLIAYISIIIFLLSFQVLFNIKEEVLTTLKSFGVITLTLMSFFMNIKKFEEIFDSKPGCMIFLTNVSRGKILLSHKAIQLFQFLMIVLFLMYGIQLGSSLDVTIFQFFTYFIFYFLVLSSMELSVTIKKVLIKSEILSRILFIFFLLFSFGPIGMIVYSIATGIIIERKLDIN